ncbi:hypothetical protein BJ508DRAFT_376272 [Ascobolus immersus RN42]|uniref:F-box domain-containing protein n=1 Tax=Ascobolus immersus RN42 TaxID=1160509 RepID=A0A3N4I6L7_ASCIM|nr:hypothetical protein BJ508DRAFT_376272 [Ascobolus immersus RN42]
MASIMRLPPELLLEILSILDITSLEESTRVNRTLHALSQDMLTKCTLLCNVQLRNLEKDDPNMDKHCFRLHWSPYTRDYRLIRRIIWVISDPETDSVPYEDIPNDLTGSYEDLHVRLDLSSCINLERVILDFTGAPKMTWAQDIGLDDGTIITVITAYYGDDRLTIEGSKRGSVFRPLLGIRDGQRASSNGRLSMANPIDSCFGDALIVVYQPSRDKPWIDAMPWLARKHGFLNPSTGNGSKSPESKPSISSYVQRLCRRIRLPFTTRISGFRATGRGHSDPNPCEGDWRSDYSTTRPISRLPLYLGELLKAYRSPDFMLTSIRLEGVQFNDHCYSKEDKRHRIVGLSVCIISQSEHLVSLVIKNCSFMNPQIVNVTRKSLAMDHIVQHTPDYIHMEAGGLGNYCGLEPYGWDCFLTELSTNVQWRRLRKCVLLDLEQHSPASPLWQGPRVNLAPENETLLHFSNIMLSSCQT